MNPSTNLHISQIHTHIQANLLVETLHPHLAAHLVAQLVGHRQAEAPPPVVDQGAPFRVPEPEVPREQVVSTA